MSTSLTTSDRHRSGSLRDSVRRILNLSSGSRGVSRSGIFDRAQNTNIQSATFTINQYGALAIDTSLSGTGTIETAAEGQNSASGTPGNDPPARPRRESPDVYVDCLMTKGRGYPLWIPSPNRSLPISVRALGVCVGDVGVLTPEGGFDILFNIFYDATHPINAAVGVPDTFSPFSPPPTAADTQHFVEWDAGSFLADSSIVRVDNGRDRSSTTLEATSTEGAVLMIPEDIYTTKLKITTRLRKYVADNTVVWYRYVKHTLGHDIENGDLRVVYGCRKSTGFGIATAFNTGRRENTRLSFLVESSLVDTSRSPYRWTHTGSAEVKAGPSPQSNVGFSSTDPVRNQCLLINTIDTRLSTEIWESAGLSSVMFGSQSPIEPNYGKRAHATSTKSSAPASKSTSDSFSSPGHEHVFHPSVILHDILEAIIPGLSAYIVCDDDWAPFISDTSLNVCDFVGQILENRIVVEDQGMLFFCASSNIDLPQEIDHKRGAQIRFSHIDNSSDTSHSHWKAERLISSGGTINAVINNISDMPSESATRVDYSDIPSITMIASTSREQEDTKTMGGTKNSINEPSAQFVNDGAHSPQAISTLAEKLPLPAVTVRNQSPAPSVDTWTEPPQWRGYIEHTGDALLILEAARQGLFPRVTRRLVDSERRMITSGSVFVFYEEESGIKRWTDGFFWSPSRILGNFLLYRETDKRGAGHRSTRAEQERVQQDAAASSPTPMKLLQIENQDLSLPKTDDGGLSVDRQRERALIGHLTNSYTFKADGLMKKTFSATINGVTQHLISYYKIADVESGRLRSPSSVPELAALNISMEYLDKTHFRDPPKMEIGRDGIRRYRSESDNIEGNYSMSISHQTTPRRYAQNNLSTFSFAEEDTSPDTSFQSFVVANYDESDDSSQSGTDNHRPENRNQRHDDRQGVSSSTSGYRSQTRYMEGVTQLYLSGEDDFDDHGERDVYASEASTAGDLAIPVPGSYNNYTRGPSESMDAHGIWAIDDSKQMWVFTEKTKSSGQDSSIHNDGLDGSKQKDQDRAIARRAEEPWNRMETGHDEIWENPSTGRFIVSRRNNNTGQPSQQQRVNIYLHLLPQRAGSPSPYRLQTTIHVHSKVHTFSLYRTYRKMGNEGGGGRKTQVGMQPEHGRKHEPADRGKYQAPYLLAPIEVQKNYTRTHTARPLESHGLLDNVDTLGRGDVNRSGGGQENDRLPAYDKSTPKIVIKEPSFEISLEPSRDSSTNKITNIIAATSSKPFLNRELASQTALAAGGGYQRPNEIKSPQYMAHRLPTYEVNEEESDSDDLDSIDGHNKKRTRLPYSEVYGTLPAASFEQVEAQVAPRRIFGWGRVKSRPAIVKPSYQQPYMPPWPVSHPRLNYEKSAVDDLNASFTGLGLLPHIETKGSSSSGKRRTDYRHSPRNKGEGKQLEDTSIFADIPRDMLFMILPLWPGETESADGERMIYSNPPPVNERLYLVVLYRLQPSMTTVEQAKVKAGDKKRGKASSKEESNHVLITSPFHMSARIISHHDLQGTGIRIPEHGLSVCGPMEEAEDEMPRTVMGNDYIIIGLCNSRSQGIEFLPYGFATLGLAKALPSKDPEEDKAAVHNEANFDDEVIFLATPIGRAVMEILFAGSIAVSSFGQ